MKSSGKVTVKQEKLINLLLTERTIDLACSKAGVGVTTYWRWMQEPQFLKRYRQVRKGILENTVAKLQSITFNAIDALERNLNCENPSVEIRCAGIILEQAIKGLEMLDVEGRIESLEELIREMERRDVQI